MIYRLDGNGPLYEQLYRSIRQAILGGELKPGNRLESTRALARNAKVSRNVAIAAYDQLMAEGYIESRRGAGSFVAQTLPDRNLGGGPPLAPSEADPEYRRTFRPSEWSRRLEQSAGGRRLNWAIRRPTSSIEFRYGSPNYGDFPHTVWNRIVQRRQSGATIHQLDYGPPEGESGLREALAAYLRQSRGVICQADQLLIVNGSQQGLDLVTRVLIDPGDTVVVEEPHYAGARWILESAGARLKAIKVDDAGLDVDRLGKAAPEARLAVVTPSHQFPSGGVMTPGRRRKLLEWAVSADAMILEDDYDSEFRYDGLPHEALQAGDREGRVIYSGTFSKVMFPSLRLGYLVLPPELVRPLTLAKATTDTGTSTLQQAALAEFMTEGHFERHLRRMRSRHGRRREILLESIGAEMGGRVEIQGANAGLHVLMRVPGVPREQVRALTERAREQGVGVHSSLPFYLKPPPVAELILGYGALQERDIREGIRRLAGVIESFE